MMEFVANLINSLTNWLSSFGLIGAFLLIFLESMIPVLPFSLFVGLNILAFGNFVGYTLSYVATVCGTFCVFLFFRYVIKKHFDKWIGKRKKKDKIDKAIYKVTHFDFNALVVVLAIPFLPTSLLNVGGGLSDMDPKKYLLALAISKISVTYFWGYICKSLLESVKSPKVLIQIVIMLVIAYIVSKIVEKVFKLED